MQGLESDGSTRTPCSLRDACVRFIARKPRKLLVQHEIAAQSPIPQTRRFPTVADLPEDVRQQLLAAVIERAQPDVYLSTSEAYDQMAIPIDVFFVEGLRRLLLARLYWVKDDVFRNYRCTLLETLSLRQCYRITDASVQIIASQSHLLTTVNLGGCCEITDNGISAIAENCPRLQRLYLSGCRRVTDASLKRVSLCCPDLSDLGVARCRNVRLGVEAIAERCKLTSLDLYLMRETTDDLVVKVAVHCPDLLHLYLSSCKQVTDRSICEIARNCPSLRSLYLNGCTRISDASISMIASSCHFLENLALRSSQTSDHAMSAFARMLSDRNKSITDKDEEDDEEMEKGRGKTADNSSSPSSPLPRFHSEENEDDAEEDAKANDAEEESGDGIPRTKVLVLDNTRVTDASLVPVLSACGSHLKMLKLKGLPIRARSFSAIAQHCLRITSLKLSECYRLKDADLVAIATACGGALRTLHVDNCFAITDASVCQLPDLCPRLTNVNLNNGNGIARTVTSAAAIALCTKRPLTKISLSRCHEITDECAVAMASCDSLVAIDISGTEISDAGATSILARCTRLRRLDLSHTAVSQRIVDVVMEGFGREGRRGMALKRLNLSGCAGVTDEAKQLLRDLGLAVV